MNRNNIKLLAPLLSIILIFSGCSKKDEANELSAQKASIGTNLVSRIPTNAAGFFSWRSDQPEFQKFRKAHWADGTGGFLKKIEESSQALGEEEAKNVKAMITVLEQSGIIPKNPDQPDSVKEGVLFVSFNAPEVATVALYLQGYPTVNFENLITTAQPLIKQQGLEVEESSANGRKILKVNPPPSPTMKVEHIFVVATKEKLAVVNDLAAADRLFGSIPDDGFQAISNSPLYQRSTKLLNIPGEQFAFGFLDFSQVAAFMKTLPDIPRKEDLDSFPLQALAISQSINDGIVLRGVATLDPKDEKQKHLLENLSKQPENTLAEAAPEDSALFVSIDKQLLQTIKEGALSEATPEERQAAGQYLQIADSIKGIGILLRQGSGDSPFPDFGFLIQTSQPGQTFEIIKSSILMGLSLQLNIQKWMEKSVEGIPVSYVMTPLGVGLYLASVADRIVVTSTESAMQKLLTVSKNGSGSLVAKIKSRTTANGIVSSYISFAALAQLIEAVESSLAMFTGGANNLSVADIQYMKRLGNAYGGISIQDGSVVFDGLMTYAPQHEQ